MAKEKVSKKEPTVHKVDMKLVKSTKNTHVYGTDEEDVVCKTVYLISEVMDESVPPEAHEAHCRVLTVARSTKDELDKRQLKELKAGRAKMLACGNCGKKTYFGAMNLISLGISGDKPSCGYKCNKAMEQVS